MGEFDTTLGALCISYVLAWGLFGAVCMQCFTYFQRFPRDSLWVKSLVIALLVLDTVQLLVIGQGTYYWIITHYGDPAILDADSPRTIFAAVLVTVNTSLSCFLARRVYILESFIPLPDPDTNFFVVSNRNIPLTALIVSLSTAYISMGLVAQVKIWQLKKLAQLYKVQTLTSVGLAFAAAADLIIAISLVLCLRRSRTGIKSTDSTVNSLVLYAMNTGLLTAIIALCDMIFFLVMPNNFIHLGFNFIAGKLYTNSLLATLNFRDTVRNKNGNGIVSIGNTMSLSALETQSVPAFNKFRTGINISTVGDAALNNTMVIGSDEGTRSISERKFFDAI
ncbi:hypothetical protein MSAN_01078000 [Mycena sanguinolenta]|uniref:DUF6534 domain-containing protein n=1 Tax=Mycena sanguinolenta TaxID=230812 RepID=A0A8H6YS46_9AGAR|nr:hypothetical protein MSAN_01078000 [Mycena sanguinolenta]